CFFYMFELWRLEDGGRLTGALGTAAILSVIIIPTISVHLYNLMFRKRVLVSFLGFFISLISLFLTQSRAGILMLVIFFVINILRKPTITRIILVFSLGAVFTVFLGDNISTDRYEKGFEDANRKVMLESSVTGWTASSKNFVFGSGYGSIWQWAEFQNQYRYWDYNPWKLTEYGYVMYHPHSIFNQLVVETGVIGLIPFLLFLCILIRETIRSLQEENELKLTLLIALISTIPTF